MRSGVPPAQALLDSLVSDGALSRLDISKVEQLLNEFERALPPDSMIGIHEVESQSELHAAALQSGDAKKVVVDIYCGEGVLPQMNTDGPNRIRHTELLKALNAINGVTTNFRMRGQGNRIFNATVRDPGHQLSRTANAETKRIRNSLQAAFKTAGIDDVRWPKLIPGTNEYEEDRVAAYLRSPSPRHELEKAVGKLVLVFHDDEARRAVPCLILNAGGVSFVITSLTATTVPDAMVPAIDRRIVECGDRFTKRAQYDKRSDKELSVSRLLEYVDTATITDVATPQVGETVFAVFGDNDRLKTTSVYVVDVGVNKQHIVPKRNLTFDYKGLIAVDKILPEGTPVFHNEKLVGITILGERFGDPTTGRSWLIPASRVLEKLQELDAEGIAQDRRTDTPTAPATPRPSAEYPSPLKTMGTETLNAASTGGNATGNPRVQRTLNDVTAIYNQQTELLRAALFSVVISDLTTKEMRAAMLHAAEQYRLNGKVEIASALKRSVAEDRLVDELKFMGQFGTHTSGFRQITPGFQYEGAAPAEIIVLSKAELRYRKSGVSSSTWGDIHPPIIGGWELVSVEEQGVKLNDKSFERWKSQHRSWSSIHIDNNKLLMIGDDVVTCDFAVDHHSGMFSQFTISRDGKAWRDGVLMSNGSVVDGRLYIATHLHGKTTPTTFKTEGTETTVLMFRRINAEAVKVTDKKNYATPEDLMQHFADCQFRNDVPGCAECYSGRMVNWLASSCLMTAPTMTQGGLESELGGELNKKSRENLEEVKQLLGKHLISEPPAIASARFLQAKKLWAKGFSQESRDSMNSKEGLLIASTASLLKDPRQFLIEFEGIHHEDESDKEPRKQHIYQIKHIGDRTFAGESFDSMAYELKHTDGRWWIHGVASEEDLTEASSAGRSAAQPIMPDGQDQPSLIGTWRAKRLSDEDGKLIKDDDMAVIFDELTMTWMPNPDESTRYVYRRRRHNQLECISIDTVAGESVEKRFMIKVLGPTEIKLIADVGSMSSEDQQTTYLLRKLTETDFYSPVAPGTFPFSDPFND